jgi:phosphomannomutase
LAEASGADLVIANDPDADRCAVAVPVTEADAAATAAGAGMGNAGPWRMLRGDEVGSLLGAFLAEHGGARTFATTIVSSTLLGKIAKRHGIDYRETLTGFKWLTKIEDLSYAYEEALGYCVDPDGVRDKDGITAALLVAELAATLKADGRTLLGELERLAAEYGRHATDQLSVRVADLDQIPRMMAALRSAPPKELAGLAVTMLDDLSLGSPSLPPTDGLRLSLEGGARVVIRPSGTEPKLKCYLEVVTQGSASDAAALLNSLKDALQKRLNAD